MEAARKALGLKQQKTESKDRCFSGSNATLSKFREQF